MNRCHVGNFTIFPPNNVIPNKWPLALKEESKLNRIWPQRRAVAFSPTFSHIHNFTIPKSKKKNINFKIQNSKKSQTQNHSKEKIGEKLGRKNFGDGILSRLWQLSKGIPNLKFVGKRENI